MKIEPRSGLEFRYNIINLSCEVHDGRQNMQMRYTYLSDGTKISALDAAGKGHLGNVRSVIDLSGSQNASTASLILEQDDYLPYGTKVINGSQSSLSSNRYRYAGKEEQRIGSFNSQLLDFGAKSYDPWTCRWTTVDPLAHKYFGMSPYNYCGNDPVNFFDPDGMTDCFDNDGNFLYNDGEDNGEMRTLDALHFWGLVIEFVHNSYSSQVKNSNLTDDALIKIVSHYNETGYKVRPKDPQKDDTCGDMATVFNPDGTVEVCVDVLKCFNKGFFDVPSPQRELDAIESQRNHPSWKRTTESFKSGVKVMRTTINLYY